MATALKEVYSPEFFTEFYQTLRQVIPEVKEQDFMDAVFDTEWDQRELKQRMTHIAQVLRNILNPNYHQALRQVIAIIDLQEKKSGNGFNFEFMFFPEFIIRYGLDEYDVSIQAIERITQYTSCEFVVRHFIVQYPEKMIAQMQAWTHHPHAWVRRLASEGMRTRLPWAIRVPVLMEEHRHILPILEKLINDPSDWVRLSVSNSLNDLSKDKPEVMIGFVSRWINHSPEVNRALKHASRGLLKKGHPEIMAIFGVNMAAKLELLREPLQQQTVRIGDPLHFEIHVQNQEKAPVPVRIEYRIHFLRGNGTQHIKTFKITEKEMAPESMIQITKQHHFKLITTRRYYPGQHKFSLLINGVSKGEKDFELLP